jgi:hypothetical protein
VNIAPQAALPAAVHDAPAAEQASPAAGVAAAPAADEGKQADAYENDGNAQDNRDDIANAMRELRELRAEKERWRLAQGQQTAPSASLSLHEQGVAPPQREPSPGTTSADIAMLARFLQDSQAQQAEQMRKQQAQMLLLQSVGELPTFSGKGGDPTIAAQDWLRRAEDFFAAREVALEITAAQADKARLLSAANALQDDARRWYNALPQRPQTWAAFRDAIRSRFCSVPDERVRVDRLHEFVEKAVRLRDKLNAQGMQALATRFSQLAGEVPDEYVTTHGKFALLARILPQRYAEVVLKEDAKRPLPALHEVINTVLARATHKEQAASYAGAAAAVATAAPLGVDAVSVAALMFGLTQEEAARYVADEEGWAPHDTNGPPSGARSGAAAAAASFGAQPRTDSSIEHLLNAIAARVGAGPPARDRNQQSRRNAPSDVRKEIPEALRNARKEAGLCIKCGVAKYEGGSRGHNSRTCKAPVDTTTSAADGRKKANF